MHIKRPPSESVDHLPHASTTSMIKQHLRSMRFRSFIQHLVRYSAHKTGRKEDPQRQKRRTRATMSDNQLATMLLWAPLLFNPLESSAFIAPFPHSSHDATYSCRPLRHFPRFSHTDTRNVPVLNLRRCDDEDFFLHQVDTTVDHVFQIHSNSINVLDLPEIQRESVSVARRLNQRLQSLRRNNDCPRCWMQRKHCICAACPPVDGKETSTPLLASLDRIFLVMHHKEIGLKLDTAKLILSSFPSKCRLVVAGIDAEYQQSMFEMIKAVESTDPNGRRTCLLLFPDDTAKTLNEIVSGSMSTTDFLLSNPQKFDLIVLDGTWSQARKFVARYFSSSSGRIQSVKLSDDAVGILESEGSTHFGHQLRRHCTSWRQVGTFEAARLFLRDWEQVFHMQAEEECLERSDHERIPTWKRIESYQRIANDAARKELGPPRTRTSR
jgi:DTW domain-containing protein YfiP